MPPFYRIRDHSIRFARCQPYHAAAGESGRPVPRTNPTLNPKGIVIGMEIGSATLGANTFPDPPGNEQNVCDNRA